MKTINKVSLGLLFCAVFLGLAAYGVSIKIETKPQAVNAAVCANPVTNIKNMSGITKVAIWEQSGGAAAVASTKYEYAITDSRLLAPDLTSSCMFNTGLECYNIYFSDANGTANPNGSYITAHVFVSAGAGTGQNAGGNVDAVGLYVNNQWIYADSVPHATTGTGAYNGGSLSEAIGSPNSNGLSGITFLGGPITHNTITVGFCNPATGGGGNTCTPNGTLTQKCVGSSVYNFNSCDTQTTLVVNCSGTCLNGACVNGGGNTCTPNGTLTQKCVGNSIYNFNSCDVQGSLVQTCAGTCANAACVTTSNNTTASVTTNSASNIVSNSATLNGYLNSLGGDPSASVWFQWGTTTAYSNGNTTPATVSAAGPFSFTVTSLTPNTVYHFRAAASNGAGTVFGSDMSFTSAQTASLGQVQTLSANTITTTSVNLNGQLSSLGGAASGQVFFQWGPTVGYGNQTSNQTQNVSGPFSQMISPLTSGTTYHVRAGLTTTAGTIYGDDQTFTTNQNNNGGGGTICTSNSYQQCTNGSLYWYNSCGVQQSYISTCGNTTTCTAHFSYRCAGNGVYWFDSCGNQQELYQACNGNQTCPTGGSVCVNQNINNNYGNLTVNVRVRNLSSGNLNWSTSVSANPSDILQYQITLQNNSNTNVNNIVVRETLPSNLYYNNNLMVDGIANSGNIISGVNIGSLSYGQTRTVTYQVQVAPAQNFSFGSTTVYDAVNITSDSALTSGSASVMVNRSGVLGATDVSTGLTNNFWVDSFFLPLMLALAALWAWKSGALNNLAIAGWVSAKKAKITGIASQSKLESKIAEIKERENA